MLFTFSFLDVGVTPSSAGAAKLQWVCGDAWNRGWNLQAVRSFLQHSETEVGSAGCTLLPHDPTRTRRPTQCLSLHHRPSKLGGSLRATGVPTWTRMCSCRISTVSVRCARLISGSCPTLCSPTSCTTSLLWVAPACRWALEQNL